MDETNRVFIIAEAGVNHNGSLELAKQLIDIAAEAGTDAVKFQTFKAEKEISRFAPKAEYQLANTDPAESQLEMAKKLEFDQETHQVLIDYCHSRKIVFLSAPSDLDSLDLLTNTFNLPCVKIPSGEITNGPLLLKAAQSGKSIILSTGMSTLGEVETALSVLAFGYISSCESPSLVGFRRAYFSSAGQDALQTKVKLLHCTTEYPAPFTEVNLRAMDALRAAFHLPTGFSDHTVGIAIPIAAVARGAVIIEKHFTVDKNLPGPDHRASLEPEELKAMVQSIRQVESALGCGVKVPVLSEIKNMNIARKSLVANTSIRAGEVFTEENLTSKRPGSGISPMSFWDFLGQTAMRDYKADEPIDR